MPLDRIEIVTDYCAHCHEAIDRVPYQATGGEPLWAWTWIHHNTEKADCDCSHERARP